MISIEFLNTYNISLLKKVLYLKLTNLLFYKGGGLSFKKRIIFQSLPQSAKYGYSPVFNDDVEILSIIERLAVEIANKLNKIYAKPPFLQSLLN